MANQSRRTSGQGATTRKQRPAVRQRYRHAIAPWPMLGIAVGIGLVITVWLAIGLLGGTSATTATTSAHPSILLTPGTFAPDIHLTTALGGQFHLAEQRGHVIVLAFVQTQPDTISTDSLSQVVSLESMEQQYGAKGVEVVLMEATALITGTAPAPTALLNTSYDWHLGIIPLVIDNGGVARQYGVQQVPTTFVIGRDGHIVQRFVGTVLTSTMAATLQALVGPPAL